VNRPSITNNKDEDKENLEKRWDSMHVLYSQRDILNIIFLSFLSNIRSKNWKKQTFKTYLYLNFLSKFELTLFHQKNYSSKIELLFINRCHEYPIQNRIAHNLRLYTVSILISVYLLVDWCIYAYSSVHRYCTIYSSILHHHSSIYICAVY
jgi:hypothetical protein